MKSTAALYLVTASIFLIAGCSSQSSTANHSNVQSTSTASVGGCHVDANAICQSIVNQPILDASTGQTIGNRELAERSARTAQLVENVQIPNGALLEIQCETNAQHNTITYAHLLPGAPLSSTDVAWLKDRHLCTE